MKKVVLKLEIYDDKEKKKAMKTVSSLSAIDMKDKKLTVIGDVDPIAVVNKLRKVWHTELVTVGPAKEAEKKKDEKKDQGKEDGNKNKKDQNQQIQDLINAYQSYNPYYITRQYVAHSTAEENPNACVIC